MAKQQTTVTGVLRDEHHWIDGQFQTFKQGLAKGRVDGKPFQDAAKVLHRHIYLEEEVLFPEVEARGLMGPTMVMAQEHGQICSLLDEILDLIVGKASAGRVQDAMRKLEAILSGHNFKEENVLYPAADEMLSGEGDGVISRLKEAKAPEGWTCRAHDQGD